MAPRTTSRAPPAARLLCALRRGLAGVRRGRHLLLAVSGGADSVAMLAGLRELGPALGLRLTVGHLNHGIRGRAAAADARFVRALCRRLGVRCLVGRADVPRLARRRRVSLEMAAREARYAFLARAARRVGADAIGTAHTADDQAETVLLKLARGAGLAGLAGIAREGGRGRPLSLLRPLLGATRAEVEAFLRARGLEWREDATNRDPAHLRNRVRHEILPLLERRLNPAVRRVLARTAGILREEDAWLDRLAREQGAACVTPDGALDLGALGALDPACRRRVLRLWLAAQAVPAADLDFALAERLERLASQSRGSGAVPVGAGVAVVRTYGRLRVAGAPTDGRRARPTFRSRRVAVPGVTPLPALGLRVAVRRAPGIVKPRGRIGVFPAAASLDAGRLGRRRLMVRPWRRGDRMAPFGLEGTRKLQDIFTDAKVPAGERGRVPVFVCGDELVWVPGYRVARAWAVQDAARPAVQIEVRHGARCASSAAPPARGTRFGGRGGRACNVPMC